MHKDSAAVIERMFGVEPLDTRDRGRAGGRSGRLRPRAVSPGRQRAGAGRAARKVSASRLEGDAVRCARVDWPGPMPPRCSRRSRWSFRAHASTTPRRRPPGAGSASPSATAMTGENLLRCTQWRSHCATNGPSRPPHRCIPSVGEGCHLPRHAAEITSVQEREENRVDRQQHNAQSEGAVGVETVG